MQKLHKELIMQFAVSSHSVLSDLQGISDGISSESSVSVIESSRLTRKSMQWVNEHKLNQKWNSFIRRVKYVLTFFPLKLMGFKSAQLWFNGAIRPGIQRLYHHFPAKEVKGGGDACPCNWYTYPLWPLMEWQQDHVVSIDPSSLVPPEGKPLAPAR